MAKAKKMNEKTHPTGSIKKLLVGLACDSAGFYKKCIEQGFTKTQAFTLTRDSIRHMMQGVSDGKG